MDIIVQTKRCRKCNEVKPLDEFHTNKRAADRHNYYCRTCVSRAAVKGAGYRHGSVAERFWKKVNKEGPIHPVLGTACWIWNGATYEGGYGKIGIGSTKDGTRGLEGAHRIGWMLENGDIPDGLFVCHRCDNPPCVRADHLFLGTCADNLADCYDKGRSVNRHTRLTIEDVKTIRELSKQEQQKVIAERYGLDRSVVSRIINMHSWKRAL